MSKNVLVILVVLGIAGAAFYFLVHRKRPGTAAFDASKGTRILAATPSTSKAEKLLSLGTDAYNLYKGTVGAPVGYDGNPVTQSIAAVNKKITSSGWFS